MNLNHEIMERSHAKHGNLRRWFEFNVALEAPETEQLLCQSIGRQMAAVTASDLGGPEQPWLNEAAIETASVEGLKFGLYVCTRCFMQEQEVVSEQSVMDSLDLVDRYLWSGNNLAGLQALLQYDLIDGLRRLVDEHIYDLTAVDTQDYFRNGVMLAGVVFRLAELNELTAAAQNVDVVFSQDFGGDIA